MITPPFSFGVGHIGALAMHANRALGERQWQLVRERLHQ
jgi:hypothetical protein